jgi:hypothetical protein
VCECVIVLFASALGFLCICTTTVQYLSMCLGHGESIFVCLSDKHESDSCLSDRQTNIDMSDPSTYNIEILHN